MHALAGVAAALFACLFILLFPGAAHAAGKSMVYLSTSGKYNGQGEFLADTFNNVAAAAFKDAAQAGGDMFFALQGTLDNPDELKPEEKELVKQADVVVIYANTRQIHSDNLTFIKSLMLTDQDPLRPQTFIILADSCCDNYKPFLQTVATMGGWSGVGMTSGAFQKGYAKLNEQFGYSELFTAPPSEIRFVGSHFAVGVPPKNAIYNLKDSADNTLGVFLPMKESLGGTGPCVFLFSDSDVVSKRDEHTAEQVGNLAKMLTDSALQPNCPCKVDYTPQCPAGYEAVGSECKPQCPTGQARGADGKCHDIVCPTGQVLREGECVTDDDDGGGGGGDGDDDSSSPSTRCLPPEGCSSAPAAGWSALLGLGAALSLLALRRRRRKE